jgi:tRNA(Ile)-lysidine synthase
MKSLDSKILENIENSGMFGNGDKVLIAVSGGADSIALLYLLADLKERLGIDLAIGHLNHSARGDESDEDAQFVSRIGTSLGIKTFIEKIDVSNEQKKLKTSFQESGRIVRRKFLESTLDAIGGNKIALGHIADDQVETFLINLLRGSGLKGLGGMDQINGFYVRPLLNCFKSEIHEYLLQRGLKHRFDKSNSKKDYLRNRIRLDLIPNIEKNFNPNFKENLLGTIDIIRDEDNYLKDSIDSIFKNVLMPDAGLDESFDKSLRLSAPKILDYPASIRRRLLRHAINLIKGDLRSYTFSHIQSIITLMEKGISGKEICLPSGLVAKFNDNYLKIYKTPGTKNRIITTDTDLSICVPLNIPGHTSISGSPVRFTSYLASSRESNTSQPDSNIAELDYEKTGLNIQIRFPKPGDSFIPLGMLGSKKLKSFFIDTKTPREERKVVPILTTASNEIIWIFGKRISNSYRVTENTKKILHIRGEIR